MAKVTSKLQVTVPKAIAERYMIRPGDEIEWVAAGDVIRILLATRRRPVDAVPSRLRLFDNATARQDRRQLRRPRTGSGKDRGWKREDLYRRGGTH